MIYRSLLPAPGIVAYEVAHRWVMDDAHSPRMEFFDEASQSWVPHLGQKINPPGGGILTKKITSPIAKRFMGLIREATLMKEYDI